MTTSEIAKIDIIDAAHAWVGTPFARGASVKSAGCDCVGLIEGILGEFGQPIIERANISLFEGLSKVCTQIALLEAAPGDIILFSNLETIGEYHCAILADNNQIIHAHWSRGVVLNSYGNWFKSRAICAFKIKGTN